MRSGELCPLAVYDNTWPAWSTRGLCFVAKAYLTLCCGEVTCAGAQVFERTRRLLPLV